MRLNSLSFRLFASAFVWALIVLPIAAFFLISVFRESVERSFDERLNVYLTTLIASTSVAEGGEGRIVEPPSIGAPVFTIPFSGWYWQVKRLQGTGDVIAGSESLADEVLKTLGEVGIEANADSVREAYIEGPNNQKLKVIERDITFGDGELAQRYAFSISGNAAEIDQDVAAFTATAVWTLALLGFGLVLATFFQVRFGLAPLRVIGQGLGRIRSGKAAKLEGELPAEIEPLQTELNALLRSNRDIIERARTQVGNLAHALKTPLSVIRNEAEGSRGALADKVQEQATVMQHQITHYLDRARVAASVNLVSSVSDVAPVLSSLERALGRIYEEKSLDIEISCPEKIKFRGEKQDLEEMVGNLFDNSCKWASSQVRVDVRLNSIETMNNAEPSSVLVIRIDDDGPGLSEEEREYVLKRGKRLDEAMPGSGLGLSIVRDLAELYKGDFFLEKSDLGGLRASLRLPAA